MSWPSVAAARDRFVLARRSARPELDPWRYQGLLIEEERAADGAPARGATLFLTGRECPWRCAMCDLWKHTTTADTPEGAIPAQLAAAREALGVDLPSIRQIKLYNAGSFFDPRAVPESDHDRIAALLQGFERVIVESHPALIGQRVDRFLEALGRNAHEAPGFPHATDVVSGFSRTVVDVVSGFSRTVKTAPTLEVAMGLETAHPEALAQLHKRMTVETFSRAAEWLKARGVALRVFLLISPPFVPPDHQQEWLLHSIDVALSCQATAISLIPTRPGNGTLDALAQDGHFRMPRLGEIERSLEVAQARTAGRARVFVDLWEIDRFASCLECLGERRARLHAMNLEQRTLPPIACARCSVAASA